jgi:hypothetical protein
MKWAAVRCRGPRQSVAVAPPNHKSLALPVPITVVIPAPAVLSLVNLDAIGDIGLLARTWRGTAGTRLDLLDRTPLRAKQMAQTRVSKHSAVTEKAAEQTSISQSIPGPTPRKHFFASLRRSRGSKRPPGFVLRKNAREISISQDDAALASAHR